MRLLLIADLAEAIEDTLMRLVIAVREVEARHAHARVDQLPHGFLVPALGTHGADDLGLPHGVALGDDVLEADLGGAKRDGVITLVTRGLDQAGELVADHLNLEDWGSVLPVDSDHRVGADGLHDDNLVGLEVTSLECGDAELADGVEHQWHSLITSAHLREVHGHQAGHHVALRGDPVVGGDDDDGHRGLVLGEERGGEHGLREDDHAARAHVEARLDRAGCDSLEGGDGLGGVVPDVLVGHVAVAADLGVCGDCGHGGHRDVRVGSVGGLT